MKRIYYLTFIILILSFKVWAKGIGDGPNPKRDARIIKKQLKKNLKGGEANYVFDFRGDYYNTSFFSAENEELFNEVANNFLQETAYQVSFINVQDYLMNGTESKEDLERIRDEYIRGLEKNVPDNAVYFLLIPQTDLGLEGNLETQFTFNVLIGAGVDMTILDTYIKNLGLGEEEYAELNFASLVQKILLSKKFNNANLAIATTIVFLMVGDHDPEYYFRSYGRKDLPRYFQANKYKGYGMDCNACCMMYFLQSYGLIPPNTSRRVFEHLFTPLKTDIHEHFYAEDVDNNINLKKYFNHVINFGNNVYVKPQILITDISFLRGYTGQGIFPSTGQSINGTTLQGICEKFYNYKDENGKQPLKEFHDKEACDELFSKGLNNVYEDLRKGLDASYFDKHIVFVGIYLPGEPKKIPGHYCIIVNEPESRLEPTYQGGQEILTEFWVYPADDPLAGKTEVYVLKEGASINGNHYQYQEKINISFPKRMSDDPYIRDKAYFRFKFNSDSRSLKSIEFVNKVFIERRMIVEGNAFGYKPTKTQNYYYK